MASYDNGVLPSVEDTAPFTTPSNTTSNSAPALDNAKNTIVNNAYAAANAVQNHPITQNIANGPVAANVKDQTAKTQSEFSSLAASRTTPGAPAATGQQLTHYHSFFTRLLSWDHPRASGIAFASIVAFIFAARYLDILRYGFKLTYLTLAVTVLAEAAGKAVLGKGLTSQVRPRQYYTIPKDSIDRLTGDITELINFFVIESQRIVFAENVFASASAFLGAFISYYLIKVVPFWGLTLLSTIILFLTPLIYKSNKEVIDSQIAHISQIVNQQTEQVKQLASHHASRAAETTKSYASDYSAKAQEMIGNARGRSASPSTEKKPAAVHTEETSAFKTDDFPAAPKENFPTTSQDFPVAPQDEFKSTTLNESEPAIIAS